MNVGQLIALLQTQNPNALVFVDVHEDQGEIKHLFVSDLSEEAIKEYGKDACLSPYSKGDSVSAILRSDIKFTLIKEMHPFKKWKDLNDIEKDIINKIVKEKELPPFICLMTNT